MQSSTDCKKDYERWASSFQSSWSSSSLSYVIVVVYQVTHSSSFRLHVFNTSLNTCLNTCWILRKSQEKSSASSFCCESWPLFLNFLILFCICTDVLYLLFLLSFQDTCRGQDLMEVVCKHLNLLETAYFGLRFVDKENQTVSDFESQILAFTILLWSCV